MRIQFSEGLPALMQIIGAMQAIVETTRSGGVSGSVLPGHQCGVDDMHEIFETRRSGGAVFMTARRASGPLRRVP